MIWLNLNSLNVIQIDLNSEYTSNRSYNNEDALGSAIYLAFIYALNEYYVMREATAGNALQQIKDKHYDEVYENYHGEVVFVGINYDEKDKTHTCKIEKFEK